jgi:acetate kinase
MHRLDRRLNALEDLMPGSGSPKILTINMGSSSLRAGSYDRSGEGLLWAAELERIGQAEGRLTIFDGDRRSRTSVSHPLPTHESAFKELQDRLIGRDTYTAIGHRIVHGGPSLVKPHLITDDVLAELRRLASLAPNHLPQAINAIVAARHAFPGVPQVACFDSAFHHTMPRVARLYPLPRRFEQSGVVRYGFHGLSCESVLGQLRSIDPDAVHARIVIAHLGNGASMTAIHEGRSIDTTMGFTPSGGLVMGTRTGDLDPGVLLYLQREEGLTLDDVSALVNRNAGLVGISGESADMRDLLAGEDRNPSIADAIALFCYQAKKFLGALIVTLSGLDTFVFTGGIGENAAPIRARICHGLQFLGIELDATKNDSNDPVISTSDSRVTMRLVHTDEDRVVAHQTAQLVQNQGAFHEPDEFIES